MLNYYIIMKNDGAISETVSVIMIILMVLILAIVFTGLIFGANIFQQKSTFIVPDIKNQILYNKNVITLFHRAGDEVYLNSSLTGLHELGIYIDNKSYSWRAQPVLDLNTTVKPGTTVFIYYNASRNTYRTTTNAATLNTSEAQSVVDCPLKIRLVDEKAHLLISTWNWTCTPLPPTPTVSSLSPASGPVTGDTTVTITGTGFTNASTVSFGGTPGTSVTYVSATRITARSPAHAVGVVDVNVTTTGGTSAIVTGDRFTYVPVVFSISPASGPSAGGTNVTITGAGFTSASTVSFGGTAGTNVTYLSTTQIRVSSPARATGGTVDITVRTATFTSAIVAADQFTYTGVDPTITSITPVSGPVAGATTVTITGTGFINGSTVSFGGTAGTSVTFVSATRITARSPAHTAGVVEVTVTTPEPRTSATSAADWFTYVPIPTVSGISPTNGPSTGGTNVTITGTGFTSASTVSFGGTAGTSVTYVSDTQITVRSPARATGGTVDVTVATTGGTSAISAVDRFTYTGGAAPTITSITPISGRLAGGTTVTITGTGFTDASTVSFGGSPGTSVTYLSATQIRVISPSRTAGGVDVRVTTSEPRTTGIVAGDFFTYVPIPTVSSLSQTSGPLAGGTLVTITGTGFTSGSTVSFGGTAGTSVTYVSDTQIRVTSPARLAGGTVDVTVATTGGISATSSADRFTYTGAPPTITGISPASGPPAGGTLVTITGTGFTDASTVLFGDTDGTSVTYLSATQIRVSSPARPAGFVDVTVVTTGVTSATSSADRFTYVPLPTITSIAPINGSSTGGTTVTITGTGFTSGSTVSFGGISVTSTYVSATQIRVSSPTTLPAGVVEVTVTTAEGTSATVPGDWFTYVPIPTISSLSQASGPVTGGTPVIITGSGFTSGSTVSFGGVGGTSVICNSPTQITVRSPSRASIGAVDVRVTTTGVTSAIVAGDRFTYM
jgi:large repetitive protein